MRGFVIFHKISNPHRGRNLLISSPVCAEEGSHEQVGDRMSEDLRNCWEILNCGRGRNGAKVTELGECIASKEKMGHSCWIIAGTLCGDVVQGGFGQKMADCIDCEVFTLYRRSGGSLSRKVEREYPAEQTKYDACLWENESSG